MTLTEAVNSMPPQQRIKVGAIEGIGYFYIGTAADLYEMTTAFGHPELRGREVLEVRKADEVADPGAYIIMVDGNDMGKYWTTDESKWPELWIRQR